MPSVAEQVRGDLDRRAAAATAKENAVAERERQVTQQESNFQANTIAGSGRYQVGSDVQPGTCKAKAADSGNCYWPRLRDLGGGLNSIIDNGNVAGLVVIQVAASDAAL